MKRVVIRKGAAVVSLVVLAVLIGVAADASRKMVRCQTSAMTPVAPGTEMLNGSYDNLMTTFAATTTR